MAAEDVAVGAIPTIKQRRVRGEVKKLRSEAGLTQRQLAALTGWSISKIIRMESGANRISPVDMMVLLEKYGVDDAGRRDYLVRLATNAWAEQPFWTPFKDVLDPNFIDFLAAESAASGILLWNLTLLPGIVQTESYMRAVFHDVMGVTNEKLVDQLVTVRLRRQERLRSEDRPKVELILDESVLRRNVGGPEISNQQLLRLIEMVDAGEISVRVVPLDAPGHEGLRQSFVILESDDATEGDVVYLESSGGQKTIREDPEIIAGFRERWDRLSTLADKGPTLRDFV